MVIVYKLRRGEFIILTELRYMVLEMNEHSLFFKNILASEVPTSYQRRQWKWSSVYP